MLSTALTKLGDFLERVAGADATTITLQVASIVTNTGAAPIPNCLGPIVDILIRLQRTVQESKALQKQGTKLVYRCDALLGILIDNRAQVEGSRLDSTITHIVGLLEDIEKRMSEFALYDRWTAWNQRRKIAKDIKKCTNTVDSQIKSFAARALMEAEEVMQECHDDQQKIHAKIHDIADLIMDEDQSSTQADESQTEASTLTSSDSSNRTQELQVPRSMPVDEEVVSLQSATRHLDAEQSTTVNTEQQVAIRRPVPKLKRDAYSEATKYLGSFNIEIWIARRDTNGDLIAIKCPRDSKTELLEKGRRGLANELEIWSRLRHPCIIPLLGTIDFTLTTTRTCLGLVSPYYRDRNIINYINEHPDADINRFNLLVDAARGLEYLHNNFIAHGDVRGSSILVTDFGKAVICDFHMSRFVNVELDFDPNTEDEFEAELHWRAPELTGDYHPPTLKSDIWSFGMTIFEVATGKKPLHSDGMRMEAQAMVAVRAGTIPIRPLQNMWLPDNLWQLLRECWNMKEDERPDIHRCLAVLREAEAAWD